MQAQGLELARATSLLAEMGRLELITRRTVDADLIGNYRSAFRGSGLLFSDIREYQPGDDVRRIHWKATARSNRAYVKSYEEDRQLRILVALDTSNSTGVHTPPFTSRHLRALEFSALITLLAAKSGDSLGLMLFSDQVELYFPPSKSRLQGKKVLYELTASRELRHATNIAQALRHIREREKRSSLIFLISDFFSPPFEDELRALAFRNDVVAVMLDDPRSALLPDVGLVELEDAETGQRRIVDSSMARQRLEQLKEERYRRLYELCSRVGADLVRLEGSPLRPLRELMQQRTNRYR